MRNLRLALGLTLALGLVPAQVLAQNAGWPPPAGAIAFLGVYNSVLPTLTNGQVGFVQVDSHGQLLTSASVSVGTFNPSLSYNTCTATGSSCASTAIPTNTGSVILFNSGTTTVSCTLASGAATATASELQIPASSWLGLATTGYDHYACIDQSGSTSNVVVAGGGSGLPAGSGGGGGGSAITNYALETGGNLASILSAVQGAIPAGTNLIGKVGIDQTTPGTTNGVDPATIARWGLMSGTTPGTAPTNTQVIGGIYNSSAPSPTTGQTLPLQQDSSGNLNVNVKSATGVAIGSTTSGQTLSLTGCASTTYSPTATTADTWPFSCDPAGNVRIVPQASSGKVSGTNSQTSTTTTSLITAVTSERIYVQAISCSNTGSTTSLVLFQDGSGGTTLWQIEVPAGGGNNLASAAPMFWTTAGNALYFAPQSASTTVYCNASGYAGN